MTTNFFKNIANLNVPGNWKFTITVDDNGLLTVSALFNALQIEDKASKIVPPMLLRGTADELDDGFFDTIEKPVQVTAGLFNNMESYMKSLEEAKKQSRMEQDRKVQETKAKSLSKAKEPKDGIEVSIEPKINKEEKRKNYEEAMKQIAELNDSCKYGEALNLLPSVEDYPEKKTELGKKKADLERKQQQYAQVFQLFNQE